MPLAACLIRVSEFIAQSTFCCMVARYRSRRASTCFFAVPSCQRFRPVNDTSGDSVYATLNRMDFPPMFPALFGALPVRPVRLPVRPVRPVCRPVCRPVRLPVE